MIMSSDSLRKLKSRQGVLVSSLFTHLTAFWLGCMVTAFWPSSSSSSDLLVASTSAKNNNKALVSSASLRSALSNCEISLGTYRGKEYTSSQTVGQPKCLVESKFIKIQQHAVQFTPNDPVIPDWIWIDYHDRINVLVQAPDSTLEFLIFEQTKVSV